MPNADQQYWDAVRTGEREEEPWPALTPEGLKTVRIGVLRDALSMIVATSADSHARHGAQQALNADAEMRDAAGVTPCDAMPDKLETPSTDASETVSAIYRALSRCNNRDAQALAGHYLGAKHAAERAALGVSEAGSQVNTAHPPMDSEPTK